MKSTELKQQREGLMAELDVLANKPELTAEETEQWNEKRTQVSNLDDEIKLAEERENFARERASEKRGEEVRNISKGDERDVEKYSLLKALRELQKGEGSLTGIEKEMHEEAENENGGLTGLGVPSHVLYNKKVATRATLAAGSSVVVQSEKVGFIDALWAKTLLTQLGAQTMTGLTGNIDLPYLSTKPSVKWAATENAAAVDAAAALEDHNLTPKRITNFIPVSNQLLMQNAVSIEDRLWAALIRATAVKIDAGGINGAGSSGEPTGILNTTGIGSVAGGTNGLAPTLAHVLKLIKEVAVDDADVGTLAFLTNPAVRYKLQSTAVESGDAERVWAKNVRDMLAGYKAGVSTNVPSGLTKGTSEDVCSAIIFGNFNDLTIAQFGAIDLLFDKYTGGKTNLSNLIIHSYWDILIEHAASFSAMKDALTA